MMKEFSLFNIVLIPAILFVGLSFSSSHKIKWRHIESEEMARIEMDKLILPSSNFDVDYELLSQEKHEWLSAEGDSVIFFHSPYIPVQPFALVSKKWMYTFHFAEKKLTFYTVEKGLLGP